MAVKLQLDFNQVKDLVEQLSFEEKEKLARYLDDKTLLLKLRRIQESKKDIPLTLEEITEEVELVREEMFREDRY